jgi:hypothetical protein
LIERNDVYKFKNTVIGTYGYDELHIGTWNTQIGGYPKMIGTVNLSNFKNNDLNDSNSSRYRYKEGVWSENKYYVLFDTWIDRWLSRMNLLVFDTKNLTYFIHSDNTSYLSFYTRDEKLYNYKDRLIVRCSKNSSDFVTNKLCIINKNNLSVIIKEFDFQWCWFESIIIQNYILTRTCIFSDPINYVLKWTKINLDDFSVTYLNRVPIDYSSLLCAPAVV